MEKLASFVLIKALDGRPVSRELVTYLTVPLRLSIEPVHTESIQFYVLPHDFVLLILGLPCLRTHNPTKDWQSARILSWSPQCVDTCTHTPTHIHAMSIESPNAQNHVNIPSEYCSLLTIFSPTAAARLLPHHPWDCAIELLPRSVPPRARVHALSLTETRAMEEYVKEALGQGLIR